MWVISTRVPLCMNQPWGGDGRHWGGGTVGQPPKMRRTLRATEFKHLLLPASLSSFFFLFPSLPRQPQAHKQHTDPQEQLHSPAQVSVPYLGWDISSPSGGAHRGEGGCSHSSACWDNKTNKHRSYSQGAGGTIKQAKSKHSVVNPS